MKTEAEIREEIEYLLSLPGEGRTYRAVMISTLQWVLGEGLR